MNSTTAGPLTVAPVHTHLQTTAYTHTTTTLGSGAAQRPPLPQHLQTTMFGGLEKLSPKAAAAKAPDTLASFNSFQQWFVTTYPGYRCNQNLQGKAWASCKEKQEAARRESIRKDGRNKAMHLHMLAEIKERGQYALKYGLQPWKKATAIE